MRKQVLLVVLAAVVVVVVALAVWRRAAPVEHAAAAAGAADRVAASAAAAASGPGAGPGSPVGAAGAGNAQHGSVRRLASDERRRLGERIAEARQRARASAPSAPGEPPADDVIPVEQAGQPLKDALNDAISVLAECYAQQPGGDAMRDAAAMMTMTSDPELGTVIDTDQLTDAAGQPLAARLDECLRDAIDSLALPPLGKGGKLQLKYTFRFD